MNQKNPVKVLIVDDEKVVRDFLARFLELKGMVATAVETGKEAIAAVQNEDYGIAFIEVRMPLMDGLETLIKLKKIKPGIKYMMMTGDYTDLRICMF